MRADAGGGEDQGGQVGFGPGAALLMEVDHEVRLEGQAEDGGRPGAQGLPRPSPHG